MSQRRERGLDLVSYCKRRLEVSETYVQTKRVKPKETREKEAENFAFYAGFSVGDREMQAREFQLAKCLEGCAAELHSSD